MATSAQLLYWLATSLLDPMQIKIPDRQFKLAIILLNYRTPDLVTDCLETLKPEIDEIDAICIVVDNDSKDDSVAKISHWIEDKSAKKNVYLVAADSNSGFSAGHNLGISSVDADNYILLNSDTLIRPGAFRRLLETADKYPEAGLITPRLEWPDETPQASCFRYPTPLSEFINAANTGIVTRLLKNYKISVPVSDEQTYPAWVSFACVLIKKAVIDDIGLLDDGYFMYFEDTDFCFFAHKAGWKIINDPQSKIVHLRGGSSSVKTCFKNKTRVPAYYMASRTRYFYRAGGRIRLLVANIFWVAGRSISKLREVLGHPRMVSEKQAVDIWINWKDPNAEHMLQHKT